MPYDYTKDSDPDIREFAETVTEMLDGDTDSANDIIHKLISGGWFPPTADSKRIAQRIEKLEKELDTLRAQRDRQRERTEDNVSITDYAPYETTTRTTTWTNPSGWTSGRIASSGSSTSSSIHFNVTPSPTVNPEIVSKTVAEQLRKGLYRKSS